MNRYVVFCNEADWFNVLLIEADTKKAAIEKACAKVNEDSYFFQ